MRIVLLFLLAALPALGQEKPVDLKKVLSESKEFAEKCKQFKVTWEDGLVRAVGEIAYRGGGPCEYLVNVAPAKAHETIVLIDNGPWDEEKRRPRGQLNGLATVLNNAFIAAGFEKGKPFDWDRETGEVFPPKGETVYIYAAWKDEQGKVTRARMCDWLWNYRTIDVMQPGKFVYTGSMMIDEGPPDHKKWFGAEIDRLLVATLNTSTALLDNTDEGALDNGTYEAVALRIPPIGTRVTVLFSRTVLEAHELPPLKLPQEVLDARKKRDEDKK
ncbi:MAG: YdjY domain-containing protein, partial [Planctomycetota bacterium]